MKKNLTIYFLIEFILLYQLFAFYTLYKEDALPSILPYLILVGSGIAIYSLMIKWQSEKMPLVFTIVSLIIIAILANQLHYPLHIAAILAIMISFRLYSALHSLEDDRDGTYLVLTSFVAVFQYMMSPNYPFRDWLVAFIIVQFLLIIVKRMLLMKKKSFALQLSVVTFLLGTTVSSILLLPFFRTIITGIIVLAGTVFFMIFNPVIKWVQYLLIKSNFELPFAKEVEQATDSSETTQQSESEPYEGKTETVLEPDPIVFNAEIIIYLAIAIALIIFIVYVFAKGKDDYLNRKLTGYLSINEKLDVKGKSKLFRSHKILPPNNKFRLPFFNFEKKLLKTVVARSGSHTVEDWFRNLKGDEEAKKTVKDLYYKVRYGEVELTHQEYALYKDALKKLKAEKYEKRPKPQKEKQISMREKRSEIKDRNYWRN